MGSNTDSADVVGAANAEGEYSKEATRDQTYANRPDQYNSFGSSVWGAEQVIDPSTGQPTTKWTNTQNLSEDAQALYDSEMQRNQAMSSAAGGMTDRIYDEMGTPMDWSPYGDVMAGPQSAGPVGTNLNNTSSGSSFSNTTGQNVGTGLQTTTDANSDFGWDSNNRQAAEDAAYGRQTSRLDPQYEQDLASLEVQLANKGLRAGDSAYDSAMDTFNRGKTDAYDQAYMGSVSQGRAEDQQSYNQAQGAYDTNLSNDQQAYNQQQGVDINDRAADQQRYDQAQSEYNTNLSGQQQDFNQQAAVADNARAADSQAFNQEMSSNERANALRQQQMNEDIQKRQFSLNEANALSSANNMADTASTFGA